MPFVTHIHRIKSRDFSWFLCSPCFLERSTCVSSRSECGGSASRRHFSLCAPSWRHESRNLRRKPRCGSEVGGRVSREVQNRVLIIYVHALLCALCLFHMLYNMRYHIPQVVSSHDEKPPSVERSTKNNASVRGIIDACEAASRRAPANDIMQEEVVSRQPLCTNAMHTSMNIVSSSSG